MKKFENIDDLFNDSLADFGVQPPENAKDAIDAQLNKIKPEGGEGNNRNYFFLIFGAIVILFAALFFNSTEEQKLAYAKTKMKNEKLEKNNTENTHTSNQKNETEKRIEDKNTTTVSTSNNNIENKLVDKNTHVAKGTHRENKELKTNNTTEDDYVKPTLNQETKNAKSNSKKKARKHKVESLKINNYRDCILQVPTQNENSNTETKSSGKFENTNSIEQNKIAENATENNELKSVDSLKTAKNKADTAIAENKSNTSKSETATTPATQNSTKEKNKKQYFIEPFVGINYGMNNYAQSSFANQQLLKDSIKFTQPIYAYGLNLGSSFGNFKIKTGIALNQWKEQLGFSYTSKDYVTVIGDSIIINGTDTVVKHNIPVQILSTIYKANANKTSYTYLQIPVFIGYTIPLNKLEIDFTAGLIFNQLLKSNGNYKQFETNKVIDYTSKNSAPLRKNYFTAQLTIAASYSINDKIKLMLNLPFGIGLQSIYTNNYVANRKVNMLGAQVGVRVGF